MASQKAVPPCAFAPAVRAAALALLLPVLVVAQEPPRFPAAAEIVRIDAVVVDEAGRPVTGLTAADFAVEENGKPREIASFEAIVVRSVVARNAAAPVAAAVERAPGARAAGRAGRSSSTSTTSTSSPPGAEWVRHSLGPFLQTGDPARATRSRSWPRRATSGGRPGRRGSTRSSRPSWRG